MAANWEPVIKRTEMYMGSEDTSIELSRVAVPGGWLYRDETIHALLFIPEEKPTEKESDERLVVKCKNFSCGAELCMQLTSEGCYECSECGNRVEAELWRNK